MVSDLDLALGGSGAVHAARGACAMTAAEQDHVCLIVPGLGGSGPDHWQTRWEQDRADCVRVDLGCWDDPDPGIWVGRLEAAVRLHRHRRIVLVAHSLGCQAVAWWSRLAVGAGGGPVAAALLVAPPDVERSVDERVQRFAPNPTSPLPFRSVLVASRDDPHASFARSGELAARLASRLVDVGPAGHINAASRLGSWGEGQQLLEELIAIV